MIKYLSYSLVLVLIILTLVFLENNKKYDLNVIVNSSLELPLRKIINKFSADTGVEVNIELKSDAYLYSHVKNNSLVDVLFPLDMPRDTTLLENLDKQIYAIGRLYLYWHNKNYHDKGCFENLKYVQNFKFSIVDPKLSQYGLAAIKTFRKINQHTETKNKMLLAENINDAFNLIHTGLADLGLVSFAQISTKQKLMQPSCLVPQSYHNKIKHFGIVLGNNKFAAQLMNFMKTKQVKQILHNSGYQVPN